MISKLNPDMLFVFTDGASTIKGNFYESSSAVVARFPDLEYNMTKYHEDGTISIGELYAMKVAIEFAYNYISSHPHCEIGIVTDSEYIYNSVNKWVSQWSKNNWIKHDGKPVMYKDEFEYLYREYLCKEKRNKNIKFFHINSHIKNLDIARLKFMETNKIEIDEELFRKLKTGNDIVDAIAVDAKETKKTSCGVKYKIHRRTN